MAYFRQSSLTGMPASASFKIDTITVLIGAFILSGCNEKTYTVSDFENNKERLNEYRQKCQNGEIDGDSLNCRNSPKALVRTNKPTNTEIKPQCVALI